MSERLFGIRPVLAIAGLAGLAAAIGLYGFGLGITAPHSSESRSAIGVRARQFAASRGIDLSRPAVIVRSAVDTDDDAERFARTHGVDQLAEATASGFFPRPVWEARFRTDGFSSDYDDDAGAAKVTFDAAGNVLGFEAHRPADNTPAPPRDAARTVAADGLAALGIDLDGFVEPTQRTEQKQNITVSTGPDGQAEIDESDNDDDKPSASEPSAKSSQKFVWNREDPRWPGLKQRVSATVTSAGLVSFSRTSEFATDQIPARVIAAVVEGTVFGIAATFLGLTLLGALLFRLLSKDYVSIHRAVFVASLYAASVGLTVGLQFTGRSAIFESFMAQTFLGLSTGILVCAAWLAGEADAFYAWGRRSTEGAIALLMGCIRARQVARETIEGFLWGWLLLGGLSIVAVCVAVADPLGGVYRAHALAALDVGPVPLFWITSIPFTAVYAVVCLLFLPAWLHRLTKRTWIAIPVAGLIAGIFAAELNLADVRFEVLPGTLSWGLGVGVATCIIATRRGWLTGAMATFAFSTFYWGVSALYGAAPFDKVQVGLGLVLVSTPAIAAVVAGPRRLVEVEVRETPPARVSRMLELVRREEELDIARRVQNGLLPNADPDFESFEIAGLCLPANEVGGDYYDYFRLSDGRFGVAVGDVSGKGIPAAFSMTLTKGFMEVASADHAEPDRVLSVANGYLRDNLARGTFVTMAYAVLDPESRVVTCARAGHNPPAFLRHGDAPAFLQADGPALGAADTEQFDQLVEPTRVEMRQGDTLVFYTDGVTEAMNVQREQFGEERLLDTLERHRSSGSARAIVDALVGEVSSFAQHADQHDDITIVVVRVPAA